MISVLHYSPECRTSYGRETKNIYDPYLYNIAEEGSDKWMKLRILIPNLDVLCGSCRTLRRHKIYNKEGKYVSV